MMKFCKKGTVLVTRFDRVVPLCGVEIVVIYLIHPLCSMFIRVLTSTSSKIAQGEVLQLTHKGEADLLEENYIKS